MQTRQAARRRIRRNAVKSGLRFALFIIASAFLFGLSLHCVMLGLDMLHERTGAESLLPMSPSAPMTPVEQGNEPALSAPIVGAGDGTALPETEDWMLTLVNKWNPLPEGFTVDTAEVERGYLLDRRAVEPLRRMLADCRAAGLEPIICSAYRTNDYQTSLFDKQVNKQRGKGLGDEAAVAAAAEVVAVPGTSEHQLGLAVDLCALSYQLLDEGQEQTAEYQWLRDHCAEYGFILRYPDGTTEITGIIYEPWHFRYVGEKAAQEITDAGITLEEYLDASVMQVEP